MSFPIRIRLMPEAIAEFRDSEEGSWEDHGRSSKSIDPETGALHVYNILGRHKTMIEVRDAAEAETVYVAAASGTWQTHWSAYDRANGGGDGRGFYRQAVKVCDRLRPFVRPEALRMWPGPSGL